MKAAHSGAGESNSWETELRELADRVSSRDLTGAVPEGQCRTHLGKVVGSVTFGQARQLQKLLGWLGERSLARERIAPSEREIAGAVLNRPDFDPQADSLVRKEMSRLREKIGRYYQSEGALDEVRLSAGAGYLLHFEVSETARAGRRGACWLVLPFRAEQDLAELTEAFLEDLLLAIGERNGPSLVAPTTAMGYRGRMGDLREFAAETRADQVVEGSLRRVNEGISAMLWLVDGRSGHTRRSVRLCGADTGALAAVTADWLLEEPKP